MIKIFRKLAIFLVTLWARRTYRIGVRAAEQRHKVEHRTIYLAANSWHPDHLVTYNKMQFKVEKRVYGTKARLLTMNTLKQRCYYYTADKFERNGMTKNEMEIRRAAFIKQRLRMAKLI